MRIIEEGNIPVKEKKETCNKCKTKFAYTQSDTKTDRDGKYVECPKCSSYISVP